MRRRLRLSAIARQDLKETSGYLSDLNPYAAKKWVEQISGLLRNLESQPYLGKHRDDLEVGLRSAISGQHLILYRVTERTIDIVRILDARRDYDQYFKH